MAVGGLILVVCGSWSNGGSLLWFAWKFLKHFWRPQNLIDDNMHVLYHPRKLLVNEGNISAVRADTRGSIGIFLSPGDSKECYLLTANTPWAKLRLKTPWER